MQKNLQINLHLRKYSCIFACFFGKTPQTKGPRHNKLGSPTQTNEVFVVGRRSNCGDPFVASQQTASQASCDAAQVAELVDAYVSGAYVARRAGSSPVLGTEFFDYSLLGKQATARLLTRKMTCKGRFSKKAEARAGQCCMATFCCERLTPLRRW